VRFKKIIDIDKQWLEEHFHEHDNPLLFNDEEGLSINENDKIIIFGNNASGKTRIIKYLDEAISNCNDEIIIKKIDKDMFDLQKKNMDPSMRIEYDNSRSKGNIIADIANNFVNELNNEILLNQNNGVKMVILIDNPFSELSQLKQARLIKRISGLNSTIIITNLFKPQILFSDRLFLQDFNKKIILDNRRDHGHIIVIDFETRRNIDLGEKFEYFISTHKNASEMIKSFLRFKKEFEQSLNFLEFKHPQNLELNDKKDIIYSLKNKINDTEAELDMLRTIESSNLDDAAHLDYTTKELHLMDKLNGFRKNLNLANRDMDRFQQRLYEYRPAEYLSDLDRLIHRFKTYTSNLKFGLLTIVNFDLKSDDYIIFMKEEYETLKHKISLLSKKIAYNDATMVRPIESSVSMILSDGKTNNEENSEFLAKLALHYSKIFLLKSNGEYEKKTRKFIVVNTVEKYLRYKINTYEDRFFTEIIIHSDIYYNGGKRLNPSRYNATQIKSFEHSDNFADVIIIDCDGDIKQQSIINYLKIKRLNGTESLGHLLFIDINNDIAPDSHPFNEWIRRLTEKSSINRQSKRAGLRKIIKIIYDPELRKTQLSKKADSLVPENIRDFNNLLNKEWKYESEIKSSYDFKCLNYTMIRYFKSIHDLNNNEKINQENTTQIEDLLRRLDQKIYDGNYLSSLHIIDEIESSFGQESDAELINTDLINQLRVILKYLAFGYINDPDSLQHVEEFFEVSKNINKLGEYTVPPDMNYVNGSLPGKLMPLKMSMPKIDSNNIKKTGLFNFFFIINIFNIKFSPLMKLSIPKYNFRFIDCFFNSEFDMKIQHLKDKRDNNLSLDKDSFWSRIGIGWEILVKEKKKNDLFILMDLCDETDRNRLFEILMSIVDEQNLKPYVENSKNYFELIEDWINCDPGDEKLIRVMEIFNCYEIIGKMIQFNSAKGHKFWKKAWKSDEETEDSLNKWLNIKIGNRYN